MYCDTGCCSVTIILQMSMSIFYVCLVFRDAQVSCASWGRQKSQRKFEVEGDCWMEMVKPWYNINSAWSHVPLWGSSPGSPLSKWRVNTIGGAQWAPGDVGDSYWWTLQWSPICLAMFLRLVPGKSGSVGAVQFSWISFVILGSFVNEKLLIFKDGMIESKSVWSSQLVVFKVKMRIQSVSQSANTVEAGVGRRSA